MRLASKVDISKYERRGNSLSISVVSHFTLSLSPTAVCSPSCPANSLCTAPEQCTYVTWTMMFKYSMFVDISLQLFGWLEWGNL